MAAVAELRSSTALGNLGAKNAIYDIVGGIHVEVAPLPGVDPAVLAERLTECGFVTSLQPPIHRQPGSFERVDFDPEPECEFGAHEAVAVA